MKTKHLTAALALLIALLGAVALTLPSGVTGRRAATLSPLPLR